MIRCWLLLTLFVAALAPNLIHAQDPPPVSGNPFAVSISMTFINESADQKMYEDIEIFRRILDRKLEQKDLTVSSLKLEPGTQLWTMHMTNQPNAGPPNCVELSATLPNMHTTTPGMNYLLGTFSQPNLNYPLFNPTSTLYVQEKDRQTLEGIYLKGQGIVYTATLASLQPAGKAATSKPVSEWESVRRQIRNEKQEPKKAEASKPPALSDVLLKLLAENGYNFSQLGENESLTIVLTVREANQSPTARQSAKETKKTASHTRVEELYSDVYSKVRDLELLGDLHMKQEHYGLARDTFRKAMALRPGPEQAAGLARKLAQAYLMLRNVEEARSALDQALALTKEAADKKDKPTPAAKPAAALPVKLIISASKKSLAQVKAGKITFDEFRRQAHVETLRFDESRSHK